MGASRRPCYIPDKDMTARGWSYSRWGAWGRTAAVLPTLRGIQAGHVFVCLDSYR